METRIRENLYTKYGELGPAVFNWCKDNVWKENGAMFARYRRRQEPVPTKIIEGMLRRAEQEAQNRLTGVMNLKKV